MANHTTKQDDDVTENNPCQLPLNVEEILIFSVLNPNCIIAGSVADRGKNLDRISNELWNVAAKYSKNTEGPVEMGNYVVTHTNICVQNVSGWWCRGVVYYHNKTTSLYDIELFDYGTTISLTRKEFMVVPEESLEEPFLAFPIHLYNMVPGSIQDYMVPGKKKARKLVIQEKWTEEAVELVTVALKASPHVYFDQMCISRGQRAGELYIILEHEYYPLRDLLFFSEVAVFLEDDYYKKYLQISSDESALRNLNLMPGPPILRPRYPDGSRPVQKKKITEEEENDNDDDIFYQPPQLEKEHYEGIFIQADKKVRPLDHINEALFVSTIHKSLNEMDVKHLWKIQSYTWPAVSQCLDVLIIAAKNSGKTLGYVAPIANLVVCNDKKDKAKNPTVLVLCSSSNEVHNIHDMFDKVLGRNVTILIVSGFNGISHRSFTAKVFNGCHILISTPAWLRRYLVIPYHQKTLKLGSLSHIIFDSLNEILRKQNTDLLHLLKEHVITSGKGYNLEGKVLQFIAISEYWSTTIGKFAEQFRDPYLCIRSYPDAVISCGIKPTVRQIHSANKPQEIIDLVGERYRSIKTMVICCSRKEARKFMKTVGEQLKILYVDGNSILQDIDAVKSTWNLFTSGNYSLLVCTDSVLPDLQISDVQWLINYSISTTTKSVFFFRFSSMISSLKNKKKSNAVTILLDETNGSQLHGVLDLVERSGMKLSKKQIEAAEQIRMRLDRMKEGYEICNLVKTFGFCAKQTGCPYRHWVLPDADKPTIPIEKEDTVKLTVVYIHTATHFSARITERIDKDGKKHKFTEKDHMMIVSQVNSYFSKTDYRIPERNTVVGEIYGYRSFDSTYQRVKVINISKIDCHGRPDIVDIKCIDTGLVYKDIRTVLLLKLPDELRSPPSAIVEIFVVNVKPYDEDHEWSVFTTYFVKEWMEKHRSPHKFFEGKVELVLGNNVWINSLNIQIKIDDSRAFEHCSSLTTHLTKNFHGTVNKNHLKRLLTLCQIGQLPDP